MPLYPASINSSTGRQNDTTNSSQVNTRIESGWGVMTPGAVANASETVTFGTAFTTAPIVILTFGGDNASVTTYGSGGNTVKGPVCAKAHTITTANFVAHVHTPDGTAWAAGNTVFYQWMAIGS